jgi:NADH:ubiquinone oxidoreductase subunit H
MSWLLAPYVFIIVGFSLLLSFVFIWIRITFCRFRYDMLIIISYISTKKLLFLKNFP